MPAGLLGDIYALWRDMDVNKDDRVSWGEFYHGVRFRCKRFSKVDLQQIFRNLDDGRVGSIGWLTFQDKLQSIIDRYPHLSNVDTVLERACSETLLSKDDKTFSCCPLSRKRPLVVEVMDREMDVIERERKRVKLMQASLDADVADRRSLKRQRDQLLAEVELQDRKRRLVMDEKNRLVVRSRAEEKRLLIEKERSRAGEKRLLIEKERSRAGEKRLLIEKERSRAGEKRLLIEKERSRAGEKRLLIEKERSRAGEKRLLIEKERSRAGEKRLLIEKERVVEVARLKERRLLEEKAQLAEDSRLTQRERNFYREQTERLTRSKRVLALEGDELRAARRRDAREREQMADLSEEALKQARRAEEERNKWVETAKDAADRITALSDDVRKLKVKKYRLQESLASQRQEHSDLLTSTKDGRLQLEELESEKLNAKLENAKLVTDRDFYKEQLTEKQDKVEALETKAAEHQAQLENATSKTMDEHARELEIARRNAEETQHALTTSFVEQKTALSQQMSKLQAERKQLALDIENLGKQREELTQDADELRAQNATLTSDVENAQNDNARLAEESAKTSEELVGLKGRLGAFDEYRESTDARWGEFVVERAETAEKNTTVIIDFLKERQTTEVAQTESLKTLFDAQQSETLLEARAQVMALQETLRDAEIEQERLRRQNAELRHGLMPVEPMIMEEPVKPAADASPVKNQEAQTDLSCGNEPAAMDLQRTLRYHREAQTDVSCGNEPAAMDTEEPEAAQAEEEEPRSRDETVAMYQARLESANSQLSAYRLEVANLRDQLGEHENLKFRLSRLNERYNEISETVNSYKKTLRIMRDESSQRAESPQKSLGSPERPESDVGPVKPLNPVAEERANSAESDRPQASHSPEAAPAKRLVGTPGGADDLSGAGKVTK